MVNVFERYAVDHETEQKKIERTVATNGTGDIDNERRTTLSLSLTVGDKKALKMMALERETTIAAIAHEWVQEHLKEVDD